MIIMVLLFCFAVMLFAFILVLFVLFGFVFHFHRLAGFFGFFLLWSGGRCCGFRCRCGCRFWCRSRRGFWRRGSSAFLWWWRCRFGALGKGSNGEHSGYCQGY